MNRRRVIRGKSVSTGSGLGRENAEPAGVWLPGGPRPLSRHEGAHGDRDRTDG